MDKYRLGLILFNFSWGLTFVPLSLEKTVKLDLFLAGGKEMGCILFFFFRMWAICQQKGGRYR